jgi:phytoene dehydrogenase-like protein
MNPPASGIRPPDAQELFARLRQGLERELDLYRRLRELAERSLALLREGPGAPEFLVVLEEKRTLAREVRAGQEMLRALRRQWKELGTDRAAGLLAELERMTGELEEELHAVIEREERIDRLMRTARTAPWSRRRHGDPSLAGNALVRRAPHPRDPGGSRTSIEGSPP